MRAIRLVILAALLTALSGVVEAKPKNCFTAPELAAEQEIRHGIYMRDSAKRCDGEFVRGVSALWQKFEAASATKLKAAMTKRQKAWEREFPDDWQAKMTHADGRLVTFSRHVPRTFGFCDNIEELLQEIDKRGYAAFAKQAKRVRNEVIGDYKVCQ
jgi:hypothetical protein